MERMTLTPQTRLAEILSRYPFLRQEMAQIHPRFAMLQTAFAQVMIPHATIREMSRRVGMEEEILIGELEKRIQKGRMDST